MHRFTNLFIAMDRTTRTSEKVKAMERFFREAPPEDAAWGLFFLSGGKLKRLVGTSVLHDAIAHETGLPEWLIGESYEATGDFAETLSLLLPDRPAGEAFNLPLHQMVQEGMLGLRAMLEPAQRETIIHTWRELDAPQRFVFNKLITGNCRVGAARTLIIKALAAVANVTPAIMAHRFSGPWEPNAENYLRLLRGDVSEESRTQPYPYFLGYPLDVPPQELGDTAPWQAEWKYDGLRAQIIRRRETVFIWSRGDELITAAFPELARSAGDLPIDTVLDGEIVAWEHDQSLPFILLQRRINRKIVEASLWADVPVAFVAFDVIEFGGVDQREQPLQQRRTMLEQMASALSRDSAIRIAPALQFQSWDELAKLRLQSRERHVEGVMLKRRDGTYGVGRRRGDWWKWKVDPYTVDAVLIYAQGGSGRRSGLFTDYTFGVWDRPIGDSSRELVPVAKAYSGLTDDEIRLVDRFIRANTISKHGPVRVVKPELVFELAFEAIQESDRHKAGLAIRFPRMNRWRTDKPPEQADTLETLRALYRATIAGLENGTCRRAAKSAEERGNGSAA